MGFYDRCIKRVSGRCPRLVLLATNSIFHKNHSLDAKVVFLDKEQTNDSKKESTYMDMRFSIEESIYHWEFQLEEDNMAIRMYEYGVNETLRQTQQMDGAQSFYELEVVMPQQAVIFLAGAKADCIKVKMTLPDGNQVFYKLPCVDASNPIEFLVEQELYLLIPFQLLKMNSQMNRIERLRDKTKIKIARTIYDCGKKEKYLLEKLVENGILTPRESEVLLEIYKDTEEYFLKKSEKVKAEVESMGDEDYVSFSERLEISRAEGKAEGKQEGKAEGKLENLVELVCLKLKKNKTIEEIAEILEKDIEFIKIICSIATKYAPDYEVKAICEEYWKENK